MLTGSAEYSETNLAHNDDLSAGIWGTTAQVKSAVVTPKLAESVSLEDFYAHMPSHQYIFMPTREPWPASSVNSRIGKVTAAGKDGKPLLDNAGKKILVLASDWLDKNKPVEQMTWAPGFPEIIVDRLIAEGGWIHRPKVSCLNLYRPATLNLATPPKPALGSTTFKELPRRRRAHYEVPRASGAASRAEDKPCAYAWRKSGHR